MAVFSLKAVFFILTHYFFVGFFLIAKQRPFGDDGYMYPKDYLKHLANHGNKVFVKGRYVDTVRQAYPYLNIISVYDVEDAVVQDSSGSVGLEIVQTGNMLKRKNLIILGSPLFLSESLYVVDYYKYAEGIDKKVNNKLPNKSKGNGISEILEILEPIGYFDKLRLKQFSFWYFALEKNMGVNWINKPNIDDLFCNEEEINKGLRPVRLQTRYWTPSDSYKLKEAKVSALKARSDLIKIYQNIICNNCI